MVRVLWGIPKETPQGNQIIRSLKLINMKKLTLLFLLLTACTKENVVPQGIDYTLIPLEKSSITGIIPNGGGIGTTDWINPTNGLAEFWGKDYKGILFQSKCIVLKGNGFEGNYQQIENSSQYMLWTTALDFPTNHYVLSFKYKSTCKITVCIRRTLTCGYVLATLPATREITYVEFPINTNIVQILFYNDPFGGKSCFDELNIKEL